MQNFILSVSYIKEPYHYDAPSINYRFNIDSLGKMLTADADYTSYRTYNDGLFTSNNFDGASRFTSKNRLQFHQPGFIKIKAIKIDMVLPYKAINVAVRLKWGEVQNDNQYQFDSLQNGQFVAAESMSNHFIYKEQPAGSYFTYLSFGW